MKENEAPEKLWIDPTNDLPKLSGHIDKGSVEYTRADAFIDKAAKWIELSLKYYSEGGKLISRDKMVKDFKEYMEGE